ncbi:MAG: adaptor protein MecA [Lachnospira sp.]
MEFKKIDEQKFQCLLYEEDLEENNISLDDFFKNDTEKIHNLLDVVMEEAHKVIDIEMEGAVLSLQLAPQANHSILLTISSGKDDFTNMLKQAGERAAKALSGLKPQDNNKSNIIKNGDKDNKLSPIPPFESLKNQISKKGESSDNAAVIDKNTSGNLVKAEYAVFRISTFEDFEEMCRHLSRTWGIKNSLYKDSKTDTLYFVLEKGRCAEEKYRGILNVLMEYGDYDSYTGQRVAWIYEHCEPVIISGAINMVKKYL